jgi:hypothetical protein
MYTQMRIATNIRNLVGLLALSTSSFAQGPTPVATLDLTTLLSPGSSAVNLPTLAFLTDRLLAVGGCNPEKRCQLVVARFSDGKIQAVASTDNFAEYASIHRSGHAVLADRNGHDFHSAVLYSPDLKETQVLPGTISFDNQISFSGSTFGRSVGGVWTIYETSSPDKGLRTGRGSLLSVSDHAVVYQWGKDVKTETMDGKLLGSFVAKNSSKCRTSVQIIDPNRLLVTGCGDRGLITDFNGKPVMALSKQPGWGTRFGVSSDGSRLLYDTYTRRISNGQRVREAAIGVASLGLGIGDEQSNGESVHVIDTQNGKSCFDWSGPLKPGEGGRYHADISPSGRKVAIVTDTSLSLYDLPAECATK